MGKSQKRVDLERRLQETHHLAREVDQEIDHPFVYLTTDVGGHTLASMERAALYVDVRVEILLPAADPERIRRVARALADALAAQGIPYHPPEAP